MLTIGAVVSLIVYLVVIQLEEYLRFGLFDLNGLAPYEERVCQGGCEKPPCPRSAYMTVGILLTNLAIFLLDFYFTRGFALQVQREREKIAATVTAAEQVAESLALLDLDAAEVRQHSEDVPPSLCIPFFATLCLSLLINVDDLSFNFYYIFRHVSTWPQADCAKPTYLLLHRPARLPPVGPSSVVPHHRLSFPFKQTNAGNTLL